MSLAFTKVAIRYLQLQNKIYRLFTFIDEYVVDLGAQWVHGEKGNVAYELVAPLNITDHSKPMNDEIYTSTGELLDPRITKNITDTYLSFGRTSPEMSDDECQHSVGECLIYKYEFYAFISSLHEGTQDKKIQMNT